MVGNKVSHSMRHMKRTFNANLFDRRFYWPEEDCWIKIRVSAAGLRLINKIGLDAALERAGRQGLLKDVEIIEKR